MRTYVIIAGIVCKWESIAKYLTTLFYNSLDVVKIKEGSSSTNHWTVNTGNPCPLQAD